MSKGAKVGMTRKIFKNSTYKDFSGGAVDKNPSANAGDTAWIPGPGRSHMCRATKLVSPSYWAGALEPTSCNYLARMPQLLKPESLEPVLRNK